MNSLSIINDRLDGPIINRSDSHKFSDPAQALTSCGASRGTQAGFLALVEPADGKPILLGAVHPKLLAIWLVLVTKGMEGTSGTFLS